MANKVLLVFFFIFLYISILGSLNWGFIGLSDFNLVNFVSNRNVKVEKSIYLIIGFSAIVTFILSLIFLSSSSENFLHADYTEYYPDEEEESKK